MKIPSLDLEDSFWQQGYKHIAGVDEVGRGALAGPLVVAALIFSRQIQRSSLRREIRDSKQLSPAKRSALLQPICELSLGWAVAISSAAEIDECGIVEAFALAFARCQANLFPRAEHFLVDGRHARLKSLPDVTMLVKGDQRCLSIAAASILAKVLRDELMEGRYERLYQGYRFAQHKGYGTALHYELIKKNGYCPIHRCSFVS